jgi:uncharacterized membrane protein
MLWILLALTGAVANAAFFIIIKKNIRDLRPQVLTAVGFSLGGLFLFLLSAFHGFPSLGQDFFVAVIITTVLNIAGLTLIFAALSSSDLSLSVPMLSFTPAFLIGTSYLLLHELPSVFGILGICIIVCGSYVLNISEQQDNFTDPVWSMIRNRGSWYMLIVAVLFAISINFDKIVLINSDPVFGMALTVSLIGWSFLLMSAYPILVRWNKLRRMKPSNPEPAQGNTVRTWELPSYVVPALLIGLFVAIEAVSINMAYTLQIVPYVIAIKRLSIIFMVLYGTIVFSEDEIKIRLAGAGLMVIGAVIILLFA